ncbi:MAG: TolC family protein [Acidobacteriota bacterium]|jgi:outer membrane protein TolC
MKNVLRAKNLILALLAVVSCSSWLAAQEKFTLEQAVRKTLESNPDLAIDAPARAAATSELAASRAGYLPRLDVEQSVLGGDNPVYVFGTLLSQRHFAAADFALSSLNTPDPLQNLQTRILAQQNIWDFGRTRQRIEAAHLGIELTDLGHEDHLRQTVLAVVEAYYSVSLAHETLEAAQAALQSADALVKQSQSRVESGLAVEADLLRSQVYLATARQQEIQARGRGEMARASLNRLMGEPLDHPFGETATLTRVSYPLPSEDALLAALRNQRPDYQRLQVEVRQAELEVSGKKAQFLPTLGAFATWEADNPSLTEAGGSNWIAGVSLRWNVFAGGSDAALLHAARSRLEQKQRQLKAMESAMELEVRKALIQVRSAEPQVLAMQAAEAQIQEGLRILRNRYEAGLATMTDLLSAETARSATRTALAEAIYQQRLSFARMEYAAGILSPNSASIR